MNTKSILTAAAILLAGAAGAHAETYQGVHPLTHDATRSQTYTQAVIAAHGPDVYADGYGAGVPVRIVGDVSRQQVREQAVAAAHGPDPYADGYGEGVQAPLASGISRASVHAQAVAVAHSPTLNVWGEAF